MSARKVEIVVTRTVVGSYEARSYPHEQKDSAGYYNLYRVPVYNILVRGTDDNGKPQTKTFITPRFMPYFNDPKKPDRRYSTRGWGNSGLSSARTVTVSRYIRNYDVRNSYTPYSGAIVVYQTFYIHAGPDSISQSRFGSAGCIEIIGDFNDFKKTIARFSGITAETPDDIIQKLIDARKLIVIVESAPVPDIKANASRKVK